MSINRKKGQSVIEYILLVTCAIALLIIFLRPNGTFYNILDKRMNSMVDHINGVVEHINMAEE